MAFLSVLGDVEGDDEVLSCLVEAERGSRTLAGSDADRAWIFFGRSSGRPPETLDAPNNSEESSSTFLVSDVDGKDMTPSTASDERCSSGLT